MMGLVTRRMSIKKRRRRVWVVDRHDWGDGLGVEDIMGIQIRMQFKLLGGCKCKLIASPTSRFNCPLQRENQ